MLTLSHIPPTYETSKLTLRNCSLVFSYWTATLDMLERHLQQIGVSYLRIDGRVPYKDRLNVLERFKTSPLADIPVLLMSIQTGAVG